MSHILFYLRPIKNKKSDHVIWLYATWNSKRLRLSTEIKVKKSEWSGEKIKGNAFAFENKMLYTIKTEVETTISESKLSSSILTEDQLKNKLLFIISPDRAIIKSGKHKINLQTFIEEYIQLNPENLKPETISGYKTFLKNQLIPFTKKYGKDFLLFENVDSTWDEYFIKFCTENKNAKNTIDKYRKILKKIMRYSLMKEIHQNRKFEAFKRSQEETTSIFLTEKEIKEIHTLTIEEHLQVSKDLLVFSCLTGLRVSDLLQLKSEDWNEDYITIKTVKTEDVLKIPLRPTALEILKKYDGLFPVISEQKYNDNLKIICANIPSLQVDEAKYFTLGMNKRVKEIHRKWEMVSTHIGRRSFATNEYLRGTPIFDIMAITGHKKVQTFMKYVRITQQEKAARLLTDFAQRDF